MYIQNFKDNNNLMKSPASPRPSSDDHSEVHASDRSQPEELWMAHILCLHKFLPPHLPQRWQFSDPAIILGTQLAKKGNKPIK